jgi:transcriptional regulator with XRE-family HTH domain
MIRPGASNPENTSPHGAHRHPHSSVTARPPQRRYSRHGSAPVICKDETQAGLPVPRYLYIAISVGIQQNEDCAIDRRRGSMGLKARTKHVGTGDRLVGARVRAARVAAGLTQRQLGDVIDVSFQQVQKYEHGVNRVGPGRLQKIADATRKPITFFFADINGHSIGSGDEVASVVRLVGARPSIRRIVKRLPQLGPKDAELVWSLVDRLTSEAGTMRAPAAPREALVRTAKLR